MIVNFAQIPFQTVQIVNQINSAYLVKLDTWFPLIILNVCHVPHKFKAASFVHPQLLV